MIHKNKNKKKYGIIFDCDGTLTDSLGYALDSFNYGLHSINEPPRTIDEIKRFFGTSADRIFLNLLGDEEKAHTAFEYYLDRQVEHSKTTKLHSGIKELIDLLKLNDVLMAIVTGRHARDLEIVLKPHGLVENFVAIIADNHISKSKPAPDGILLAAKKMGLEPKNVIYVGDSTTDIQAIHAAGGISIAALWDSHVKPHEMEKENPSFMAKKPSDVWAFYMKNI